MDKLNGTWWVPAISIGIIVLAVVIGSLINMYLEKERK